MSDSNWLARCRKLPYCIQQVQRIVVLVTVVDDDYETAMDNFDAMAGLESDLAMLSLSTIVPMRPAGTYPEPQTLCDEN
jgi:hypothetical protein